MTAPLDLDYLAQRAEREAVLAVMAADARVAAVHQQLSRHYSDQFVRALGTTPVPRGGNIAALKIETSKP